MSALLFLSPLAFFVSRRQRKRNFFKNILIFLGIFQHFLLSQKLLKPSRLPFQQIFLNLQSTIQTF